MTSVLLEGLDSESKEEKERLKKTIQEKKNNSKVNKNNYIIDIKMFI